MLIIFDLDDTLIDTSGSIMPVKYEQSLRRMVASGLSLTDFDAALKILFRLDLAADSSRDALSEFLEILEADKKFLEIAMDEMSQALSDEILVETQPGAVPLLQELFNFCPLALVTYGSLTLQMEKLKKAGIDTRLFSKIIVSEQRDKMPHYQKLIEEFALFPQEIIVCGDRIRWDLTPAKALGCRTVHIRKGRGRRVTATEGSVDYASDELAELRGIVSEIKGQKIW